MTPTYLLPVSVRDERTHREQVTDFCSVCRTPLFDGVDHWHNDANEPRCLTHCKRCSGWEENDA